MRILSLDGLRAISIGLVLLGHFMGLLGLVSWLKPFGDVANLGVRVFFVISGYLITTLLLTEEKIGLGHFYFRRFFRIFPPYYAYLAVVFALSSLGLTQSVSLTDLGFAAAYLTNFQLERSWLTGHAWSLSVEEQFYLLWPGLLVLVGTRRALLVALAALLVTPLIRVAWAKALPAWQPLIGEAFPTIFDALATGCVLAGFRTQLHARGSYLALLGRRWLLPLLAVAITLINAQYEHAFAFWLVGETAINLMIALIVDRAVTFPHSPFGRLLNARALVRLGQMSYSIYLWQQLLLHRSPEALLAGHPWLALCLVFPVSYLSFTVLEKGILRHRDRLIPAWVRRSH